MKTFFKILSFITALLTVIVIGLFAYVFAYDVGEYTYIAEMFKFSFVLWCTTSFIWIFSLIYITLNKIYIW